MKFQMPEAELFIPDNTEETAALARTTHLAIGAHQDDLEIMAFDGILQCFQKQDKWFTGVVVTSGSGSPRAHIYADYTDEEMVKIRRLEQKKAAIIGDYAAQFLLDFPSNAVKDCKDTHAAMDLVAILTATQPEVVYTHNLADKHDTHVGVTLKVVSAIRQLPVELRPKKLYGCEVWRDLDWIVDEEKVLFDVSAHENLQAALLGVFDSQIAGGKRYDLASMGRRRAHATYTASHGVDNTTGLSFAMDLTPLIEDPDLQPLELVQRHIKQFQQDVTTRIRKVGTPG